MLHQGLHCRVAWHALKAPDGQSTHVCYHSVTSYARQKEVVVDRGWLVHRA